MAATMLGTAHTSVALPLAAEVSSTTADAGHSATPPRLAHLAIFAIDLSGFCALYKAISGSPIYHAIPSMPRDAPMLYHAARHGSSRVRASAYVQASICVP